MDNEARAIIRSLELQNEAKAQDISNAYQTIAQLEDQVTKSESEIISLQEEVTNLTNQSIGLSQQIESLNNQVPEAVNQVQEVSTDPTIESQIDFISKVAESKSKFAKEAQEIIEGINEEAPVSEPEVVQEPVDSNSDSLDSENEVS